jgi:ribosome biogenesis GTPase
MNLDHKQPNGPRQNDLSVMSDGNPEGVPKYDLGIVYKKSTGSYEVYANGRMAPCALSTRLRKQLIYPTADPHSLRPIVREVKAIEHIDPVAVGDQVRFIDAQDGSGLIVEVLPRRSKLTRRSAAPMPTAHTFEQVIVANVDQVVPVFAAANPAPKWNMLDRYLVSAESLDLPALICITKLDLVQEPDGAIDKELFEAVAEYRQIGYPVVLVSAVTGQGLGELKQALQGCISVLVGKSGVGKTSLLNALQPGLGLRVKEVSQATGKGKHATTRLEMFRLEFGDPAATGDAAAGYNDAAIVDTPGMREFGLWEPDEDDLALFFPEMQPYVGRCKFGLDCRHDEEPGCAIRNAVLAGKISPRRYKSYQKLRVEP